MTLKSPPRAGFFVPVCFRITLYSIAHRVCLCACRPPPVCWSPLPAFVLISHECWDGWKWLSLCR